MAKGESKEIVREAEPKFTKDQLVRSMRYQNRRDLLSALLDGGGTYSHSDVERIIGEFMKRTVK